MPEISRFFGIIIRMFSPDHSPPHFHAIYGEYEAVFRIEDGEVLDGYLPNKQLRLVWAWLEIHRDELESNWKSLSSVNKTFKPIPPLS